jgi:hypothetical protein
MMHNIPIGIEATGERIETDSMGVPPDRTTVGEGLAGR